MVARTVLAALTLAVSTASGQTASRADSIVPSLPPRTPLPPEPATAGITKFSFITYGDTRGRHDGVEIQAEHELVIESMLGTIRRATASGDPIRFVLESGDAIQDGSIAKQLTVSYIPLINRLTQEGGVPYFLSVGNHDVGSNTDLSNPKRVAGLANYFAANARLIPPEGSPRRLNGYPTYAFGYGNSFFIAFDSDIPADSTQFAWVKSQLETLDRRRYVNVVMFFHHPPFSSGGHGGAKVESQAATIRAMWMPLFRKHHVRLLLTGHEHLFEHWVERYGDETGQYRIDEIVSGGGGAPLVSYKGEPDLREYVKAAASEHVSVQHLARPSSDPGGNPFHYVVVHVDGERISVEVIAVDWGKGFAPYRSNTATLVDPPRP
ncbi:MAG: metallophosphoesterase family protein [Gemmatimonadaceae bacterium]